MRYSPWIDIRLLNKIVSKSISCSTNFLREDGFIIKLGLYPVHQVLHIFGRGNLNRFLDLHPISPPVLKPGKWFIVTSQTLVNQTDQEFRIWDRIPHPKRAHILLGSCRHCWAWSWCAELHQSAIQDVHLIEEINSCEESTDMWSVHWTQLQGTPFPLNIWGMQNLLLTASHSLRSSPGGNRTASLKFPLPKVESMCFFNCTPCIKHNNEKCRETIIWNKNVEKFVRPPLYIGIKEALYRSAFYESLSINYFLYNMDCLI